MRARRSSAWLPALAAILACAAALVTVSFAAAPERVTKDELLAYQAAVHPPLSDGGRLVQEQLKPAAAAAVPARAARGWVAELDEIRTRVSVVVPPEGLRAAHRLFGEALLRYTDVARLLGEGNVTMAVDAARAADRTYDDASRILQRERRRLGLGPTAEFPDPD